MGLTIMVRAESSHWLLLSLPAPLAPSPRWWMDRIRNTPRITMTTKKPTHTMMITVAAPGTTKGEKNLKVLVNVQCGHSVSDCCALQCVLSRWFWWVTVYQSCGVGLAAYVHWAPLCDETDGETVAEKPEGVTGDTDCPKSAGNLPSINTRGKMKGLHFTIWLLINLQCLPDMLKLTKTFTDLL